MEITRFCFNNFGENCYVLFDENKDAIIIDPGCYNEQERNALAQYIEKEGLKPKHVLLTHIHPDHCFGTQFIRNTYGLYPEANEKDLFMLNEIPSMLLMFGMGDYKDPFEEPKTFLKEGDIITLGKNQLHVLEVPGHSPGSIAFYDAEEKVIFTGDAIFCGSVGRTDFIGGSWNQLKQSIQTKILSLPDETIILAGHNSQTSVGMEKKYNPYLKF